MPRLVRTRKSLLDAVKAPMPVQLDPMLLMLVYKTFSDPGWIYEPKWDGWRATCFLRDGKAHFVSRERNSPINPENTLSMRRLSGTFRLTSKFC